ncbi:T9SS type B sorting domain-containing protein [uncultured Croceitalea sp.]|uniref:T9SS type B sorting domain-containing protein n=1 Tax=uncultured Croceitalea sp. TaxID=1798908 RepID=UPI00374F27B8
MNLKALLFSFVLFISFSATAQLSDLHYLPPLKQGQNNAGIREQAIYLSTPEPTTFTVNAYQGTNTTPVATFNISNVSPAVYSMSNGDNNIILVNNANTGIVLNNSGLRFESPSGNRFYVNYRGSSSAQSASLTSKGRVAMGTNFKWGGVPNRGAHPSKSNTLGIMATEDNTTINLFGYDPGCEFRVGNNRAGITDNTHQITLNANESFVYETYIGNTPTQAHEDGWIGASIVSDKDIVISNGSMNFGRQVGASNRDAGIDQPVPENRLGKEYVFVRGNGNSNGWTEFPLIIAISDNTQIFVNGSTTPIATINNGDYFEIPSNLYSANIAGANMLVQTSKDVYAYQCMAGATTPYTQGLNFVAPVNCLLPDVMDNIPDIRNMAGTTVTGGMTIIAAVNTPDANIIVNDGNGPVTLPASNPVAGSTDWKTFYIPNLNGDVSVASTGPMAVGFFGFNGARGVAGYFSGFDTVPAVTLEIRGGSGCFVGSEIFEATNSNFDAFQWYKDGEIIPGANSPIYTPNGAGEYFLRGTKGPCTYDSNSILGLYCDPDIHIEKTVDNPEIMEGETATFTIRVQNWGVGPLTNLQITDNIPTGLTLVNAFTITGSFSGNIWNIGTLDGGEVAELELEVRADEIDTLPLLSLTNTATHTQDQTDANLTEDSPSAKIVVHNDFDNDGVKDIVDLDDDNDGIYDEDECETLSFNISNGSSHTSSLVTVDNYLILDIFSLDNSFNLSINGTDIAGEIQFQTGVGGNFATFLDGFGYGQDGNPQIYTLTGSEGSPLLRVVINQSGEFELFGTRTSNGVLEPMVLTIPTSTFAWNASGNNTIIIDQAVVGPTNMSGTLLTAGCDTDNDGFPNHLDLDSDGDGCNDANEFYKDDNADGGDGGEFGTGIPVVDSNDGTVNAASYNQVFAPEILLENTSEDLGGTDINGQNVSLGQTFNYVLRFQNTGDDDAVNYTIRNILPDNVTLDNVDVTNALGTTHVYDATNQNITFTVPDNLVEIGDPEYTIVITVSIANNCSDFVSACSSTLQNNAYSTYQGVLNTSVFTDEGGSSSITACPRTPEIASNSISNDLAGCNQARTVQLCGDNTILTAGSGFTTYNWVLDTNGNGIVDGSDTVLNDGNPDSDPSTLLVTNIGDYIVEKSGASGCSDLIERITVERFGTTQTNPVINYFNQVNSDANADNDLQGEIVTCSIDGDLLPKIFLCGAADEALIQLGITDAQSIVWEKLDEASCSNTGDDCANKNGTCTWNSVHTGDNFTATESGEFRVVINYLNGCFSRFYFDIFKNELDIDYTSADILCSTPGNIRITNVGTGYGFQLLDATNNDIVVPFSANNGPNFNITTSGTYKVQAIQLNPSDNTPIAGSCIFETDDIGIQERIFSVNLSTTSEDCNVLGTITVQAINALPNYSYELRLDDGSNGGLGSLVSSQPALNDNSYTFSDVNPEDYLVVTRTQHGCFDSQQITVNEIPKLTLTAVTSENITCNAGIVNVSPSGGLPSPNYDVAIWSKDGTNLYTDEASVPDSAYETTSSFLFGYRGTPSTYFPNEDGDYRFIVRDGNGCYAISNSVRVEDLGSLSISASDSGIVCADSATASLTVSVTGGTSPYQYSLDGGTNYQNTDTFVNLPAGLYTITVMDSSNGTNCVENFDYEIVQPFRLTASASIIEDASCNPAGALVKILNANGGQAPYEYSFDGGSSFGAVNEQNLLPGTYQLVLRDDLGCTFDIDFTVPTNTSDPSFPHTVDYSCDGEGTITINPSNTSDFTYSYALDGTPNTPTTNNIFENVANGVYTVSIDYTTLIAPGQTILFNENFGTGPTTQIGEIGADYCYEPQNGTTTNCNRGPAGILVNGEYTVTNLVTNPVSFWTNPQDHTGLTDGRFLAIDVSTFSDTGNPQLNNILWARRNLEVLPNQEITLDFWAYNLMNLSGAGNNPQVFVEILDNTGTVIYSEVTNEIPKNTSDTDWHQRTITFDPGTNTGIDIVFRTNVNSNDGNDLILDDIQAYQLPEICDKTADITVVVEDGRAFDATITTFSNITCNTGNDGSIIFEVENFDASFEYQVNGGGFSAPQSTSTITLTGLSAGNYDIDVRTTDNLSNNCSVSFSQTLSEPTLIVSSVSLTAQATCNNGATLTASASGGTLNYAYQLEINDGGLAEASYNITSIERPFQNTAIFLNVPENATGESYVVRVRDTNGCIDVIDNAIVVNGPQPVAFNTVPTACYSGNNDGSIVVNVTSGNGNYEFRLDSGPWITPSPSGATTHTFSGLVNGSYDVEVRDQLGCPVATNTQTVTLNPQLIVDIAIVELSACGDGSITINATGGNGILLYAIVPANTSPTGLYSATNTLTITDAMATANPGGYDVYVQDNNGAPAICSFLQEDIILTPVTPLSVAAVPTDPECFDGLGLIDVTVTGGTAPYTYTLTDLSTGDSIDYGRSNTNIATTTLTFNGIGVGDYQVTITDENTCSVTSSTITINNAAQITADILPILPVNCTSTIESDFGFEFDTVFTPTGTVEYSNDGGVTWQSSDELRGSAANPTFSGTAVFPSIRVTLASGTICQRDFDRYIIPFPLDNLDISISAIVVDCNELQVRVQGTAGLAPYEYAFSEDPANFNPAAATWQPGSTTNSSGATVTAGHGLYIWTGLTPGRTYVFYVRDNTGCVRQSLVNVNDLITPLPVEISSTVKPTCDSAANGQITFTLNPTTPYPQMRWEIYELGNATPIEVSGVGPTATNVPYNSLITTTLPLAEGDYYIDVIQVDGANVDACRGASENAYVPELAPLAGTAVVTRNISCNLPGLISINGISGGGGAPYAYDVSGPSGFTTLTGTTNNPVQVPVNSPAGNYTVTLYDQYSCPLVLNTVALTLAPNPTISVTQDNCEAPITVTASGVSAAGNLRYAIVPNGNPAPTTFEDNGGVFTNITPGSYDVYVIDGNGCTNSQSAFVVDPVLSASVSLTKLLDCTTPNPEATINIEVLDGSSNYQYSITNTAGVPPIAQTAVPSNNFDYQAPLPGDYTITIFDTNTPSSATCDRTFVINVPNRVEPIIDSAIITTDITCIGNNDGTITISTTNSAAAPYNFEITSMDGASVSIVPTSTSATSATFTGLAPTATTAGYIITATGDTATNNCSVDSASITLSEPTTITVPTPTIVEFSCASGNNSNNASITVNDIVPFVQGGSGTYVRYEFIEEDDPNTVAVEAPAIVQTGPNATFVETNFAGGVYTINVYDTNGCVGITTATITPFDELQSTAITIDDAISCSNGGEDISINAIGSITNYTSHPGNYEFRMLPSGTTQTSNVFADLQPNSYTFAVTNVNTGCELIITHVVEEPNTFDLTVEKLADAVCFGDDGSIRLLMSDATYTGSFSWSIYNTNGTPADRSDDGVAVLTGSSPDFGPTPAIAIAAGNYLVEVVQDAFPDCSQVRSFSVSTPSAPITLGTINLIDVGCTNNQGSATINPLGGQAPYDIILTNNTTGTPVTIVNVSGHIFENLSAAQYSISVTDALGCTTNFNNAFELLLPDPISGSITATSLVCQGDTDASVSISLNPRNISTNYRFILNKYDDGSGTNLIQSSTSQTSASFDNLGSGFYNISVVDDMNCTFESVIVQIMEPIETNGMLLTTASLSCSSDASLELTAMGGTAPYVWSTDGISFNAMNETNGPNTHLFQNVTAGAYQYYIRDSFNCVSTISNKIVLNPIEPLTLALNTTAAVINCNGESTALIEAKADGGLGNYQYGLFADAGLVTEIRPYQNSGTFIDLPQGIYFVSVQSEDCETTSMEVRIDEPSPLVVNPTITDITCNGADDGSILVDVQGGSGDYQFAISPNLNQFRDENSFNQLAPGDYEVIAQDSNGCFELIEFTITEPLELEMTYTSTPEICAGDEDGTITVSITGGTAPYSTSINSNNDSDFEEGRFSYDGLPNGTYVMFIKDAMGCTTNEIIEIEAGANLNVAPEVIYECSGDTPDNRLELTFEDPSVMNDVLYGLDTDDSSRMVLEPNFNNLSPGIHFVTIAHANGCINRVNFEVEEFLPLQIVAEQQDINEITALIEGGKEGYTYYFNDLDNGEDNKFYITATDTYTVRVVDANGCESITSIFMEFIDIEIPTFFTPDGDGTNDLWLPRNIEQFPNIFIKVYDRYGRQVYELPDNEEGWNGLYNDYDLPTGDYWYVIKLNGEDDQREFIGHFTLYR